MMANGSENAAIFPIMFNLILRKKIFQSLGLNGKQFLLMDFRGLISVSCACYLSTQNLLSVHVFQLSFSQLLPTKSKRRPQAHSSRSKTGKTWECKPVWKPQA